MYLLYTTIPEFHIIITYNYNYTSKSARTRDDAHITYDSMFAAVSIYHGNDDEDFDEWADQLEALCEIS